MIKNIYTLLFCVIINVQAQEVKNFSITFSGDVLFDRGVKTAIKNKEYGYLLGNIQKIFALHKNNVVNLECPVTYRTDHEKKKWVFKADSTALPILTNAGITHTVNPNNHILDYKMEGLEDTYYFLKKYKLIPIGLAKTKREADNPVIIKDGSNTIAIFASTSIKLNAPPGKAAICNLNTDQLINKVSKYRKANPSHIIFVSLHWGIEYNPLPISWQKEAAHKIIDSGADAIIGHHPHIIQQIEMYKGKPVFYSLGNLIFDKSIPGTEYGITVGFTGCGSDNINIRIYPFRITACRPVLLNKTEKDMLKKNILANSPSIDLSDSSGAWILKSKENYLKNTETQYFKKEVKISGSGFNGIVSVSRMESYPAYRLDLKDLKGSVLFSKMYKQNIYRMETGDVDNNCRTDILLGVIKSTKFDPAIRRRLQILKIVNNKISAMWLGTSMCNELADFIPVKEKNRTYIKTIEKNKYGLYCIGLYAWDQFGLTLLKYEKNNLTYSKAEESIGHDKKI